MAEYYDFPSGVTVTSAHRLYLKELRFEYPRPGELQDPRRVLTFRITDDAGVEVGTRKVVIAETTWESFVLNFASLPGDDFEEKILNQGPALISKVPPGGTIKKEVPPPPPDPLPLP